MIELYVALALTVIGHALQFRTGINFGDEGFLWNGSLRIGQGKIPIRDYKAYDPARFYWCWFWMKLFGNGLLGLRHAAAIFQFFGLWAGLWAVGSATGSLLVLIATGILCLLWMQPRHKLFEHALSLIAVATAVYVLEQPSLDRIVLAGVATGLAGFFGRNHGVYTFCGLASLIVLMWARGAIDSLALNLAYWSAGIVVGYSPMLAMWAFIPDMFKRYLNDKVLIFIRRGGIDLPVSPPWPWKVAYAGLSVRDRVTRFLIGLHFIALPLFYTAMIVWLIVSPNALDHRLLVASSLIGVFYAHHAKSRSDFPHLCQVMQPFLIGLVALTLLANNTIVTMAGLATLLAIGWFATRKINAAICRFEAPQSFEAIDVRGDRLWIQKGFIPLIQTMKSFIADTFRTGDRIFIAPTSPMLYPLLGCETPVRSDFMLFPETRQIQEGEIESLKANGVEWALILDQAMDGRDELRFRKTHSVLWEYLDDNFHPIEIAGLPRNWQLMRHRAPTLQMSSSKSAGETGSSRATNESN